MLKYFNGLYELYLSLNGELLTLMLALAAFVCFLFFEVRNFRKRTFMQSLGSLVFLSVVVVGVSFGVVLFANAVTGLHASESLEPLDVLIFVVKMFILFAMFKAMSYMGSRLEG